MSKAIESQVWKSALSGELKPIAAVMADMGNDDGEGIYPSVGKLAWLLGVTERAVRYQLAKLKELGIVEDSGVGGGRTTTQRRLLIENLPTRPPWKTKKEAHFTPEAQFRAGVKSTTDTPETDFRAGVKPIAADPLLDPLVRSVSRSKGVLKPPFKGKEFLSTLADFESHRKEIKKPLKETSRKVLYGKLKKLGEETAIESMKDSMANGWQGVFQPRNQQPKQPHYEQPAEPPPFKPTVEQLMKVGRIPTLELAKKIHAESIWGQNE